MYILNPRFIGQTPKILMHQAIGITGSLRNETGVGAFSVGFTLSSIYSDRFLTYMNFQFLFSSFNFDLYLVKKIKQRLTKSFASYQHAHI